MPTTKPRHTITETGPVAEWLHRVRSLYPPDVPTSTILAECFVRGAERTLAATTGSASAAPDDLSVWKGSWVALDDDGRLLMADRDPRALARRLKERDLRPRGIMRVPEHDWQMEGMHGLG